MANSPEQVGSLHAAQILGVSIGTVRRWCDAGHLPHWRTPSGQRRFNPDALRAWLDKRQKTASGA